MLIYFYVAKAITKASEMLRDVNKFHEAYYMYANTYLISFLIRSSKLQLNYN